MAENYVEKAQISWTNSNTPTSPTFADDDCDKVYDLVCKVQLNKIIKNVSNESHNVHIYSFTITDITSIEEE
jgi:hypothetical protein